MEDEQALSKADVAEEMVPPIITKIRVPRRRRDLLPRRRLVDFIHFHLDRKLILISAPAGYGKTSLLTDFAHDTELPVCWYTLDAFDRDLHVFLEHLVASIAARFPQFGQRSRTFLQDMADPGNNIYPLVATLVQEIYDTIPEYFFLVLDDHHTVEDQDQISEFLDLFVAYVDENCHTIIASRTLPVFPNLSLLVARRQAAGLSIDELRFTPGEIQALAKQNYGLDLGAEQAAKLAEHTGGWITGVLLTTAHRWEQARGELPVRGRINVDVYDYLSRQVLDRQPAELRDFLLASSVLDELSPGLVKEVLLTDGASRWMEQVQARNLFVTEYAGEPRRLRFHDLFREFLQDALQEQDSALHRDLMLRAARAYAGRGEWVRAVSRYRALGERQQVSAIIHQVGADLFDRGHWDTLAGWIDDLPNEELIANPTFLLHRGKIHMERGESEQAIAMYEKAEAILAADGDSGGQAYAQAMKGYVLRYQGRYAEALAHSRTALESADGSTQESRMALALAHKNVGLCLFRMGQLAEGLQALEEALPLYEADEATLDVGMVYHDLGLGCELMGDLPAATKYYNSALIRWEELSNPGPWANTLNGLGVVYHFLGEYEKAAQALERALEKTQRAGDLRVEAYVWASLGDLNRDLEAYGHSWQCYSQAAEVAERSRAAFILTYALNGQGNLCRLEGDRGQAERLLEEALSLAREHDSAYEIALCETSLGILACDNADLVESRRYLDQAVRRYKSGGFRRDLAIASLYRASVAFEAGDVEDAREDLGLAFQLAQDLGYDQFLVVEGHRLGNLERSSQELGLESLMPADLAEKVEAYTALLASRVEPKFKSEAGQRLQIMALGQPTVQRGGESVQWTTSRSRELFFCLFQHRQGLRKEEIGGVFWPDHPPQKLDAIFRSSLYRLRRSLFREAVIFEDGVYRFNRDVDYESDLEEFERLLDEAEEATSLEEQSSRLALALKLYRGIYLEGIYADWCALERQRLRERYLNALDALAGLRASQGYFQRAVEGYQQLVAEDPYREPAHRELMRCFYRLGDRAAAIRQYQACVEILRDDLGLSPEPDTETLYLQIIN